MAEKLKTIMVDPSILCKKRFWERRTQLTLDLREPYRNVFYPESFERISDRDFSSFYGGYLRPYDIMRAEAAVSRSRDLFRPFYRERYIAEIPEITRESFDLLKNRLRESDVPESIQPVLLDEYVFLTTQSSIISRLKKPFKVFEKLKIFPLINLEKQVPEEWQETVRGIKKTFDFVNWIGSIAVFSLWLGPVAGPPVGSAVEGLRIVLIDP